MIEEFISNYPKPCNRHMTECAYGNLIRDGTETEENLIAAARNYAEHCRILRLQDKFIKNAENFLKYFAFEEYLPERYQRPKVDMGNSFNNFQQNTYDFGTLEEELLSN